MKAAVCVLVLGLCAAAMSEQCQTDKDCLHVICLPEEDYDVDCERYQCSCKRVTCNVASDCPGYCLWGWHCVDSKCRCSFGNGK